MNLSNQKSQVMQSVCGHISGRANIDTPLPPLPPPTSSTTHPYHPMPTAPYHHPPTSTSPYHHPPLSQIMVLKEANSETVLNMVLKEVSDC